MIRRIREIDKGINYGINYGIVFFIGGRAPTLPELLRHSTWALPEFETRIGNAWWTFQPRLRMQLMNLDLKQMHSAMILKDPLHCGLHICKVWSRKSKDQRKSVMWQSSWWTAWGTATLISILLISQLSKLYEMFPRLSRIVMDNNSRASSFAIASAFSPERGGDSDIFNAKISLKHMF